MKGGVLGQDGLDGGRGGQEGLDGGERGRDEDEGSDESGEETNDAMFDENDLYVRVEDDYGCCYDMSKRC